MNFNAEVEIARTFHPCFNPASDWKAVEAGVNFNRVKALLTIPLERGWYSLVPEIAIAGGAYPNFTHKHRPQFIEMASRPKGEYSHEELKVM